MRGSGWPSPRAALARVRAVCRKLAVRMVIQPLFWGRISHDLSV
jgi:hypothetical protein